MSGSNSVGKSIAVSAHKRVLSPHIHCLACAGPQKEKTKNAGKKSPAGRREIKVSRPLGADVHIHSISHTLNWIGAVAAVASLLTLRESRGLHLSWGVHVHIYPYSCRTYTICQKRKVLGHAFHRLNVEPGRRLDRTCVSVFGRTAIKHASIFVILPVCALHLIIGNRYVFMRG